MTDLFIYQAFSSGLFCLFFLILIIIFVPVHIAVAMVYFSGGPCEDNRLYGSCKHDHTPGTVKEYLVFFTKVLRVFLTFSIISFTGITITGLCINWNLFITWWHFIQIWIASFLITFDGVITLGIGYLCYGIISKISNSISFITDGIEKIINDW